MYVGTSKQFQKYDELLIQQEHWQIEEMIFEASKALLKHMNTNKKTIIICGRGNNGADGIALANLLKKENVIVFLLHPYESLSKGAQYYYQLALKNKVKIYEEFNLLKSLIDQSDIIVDAIFGTGFTNNLEGKEKETIEFINSYSMTKEIFSIDIPSGLNADDGNAHPIAIKANKTITFVANKLGFLNPECQSYIGELIIENILWNDKIVNDVGLSLLLEKHQIENLLKERKYNGYKGTYGTLSCFVGSNDYPGAALISVGAALNSGCGMVQLNGNTNIKDKVVMRYPEVVLANQVKQVNAVLFGCGKGWTQTTSNELYELLLEKDCPILIDADGLNCLSEHPEWLLNKKGPIILTPHIGEMNRLLAGDPVLSAIKFAREYNVTIVLKGPHTLITDGNVFYRIPSGDKAMATAGMGDCLAGIISSLLAQQYSPIDACLLGAYIHGLCGQTLAIDHYTVLATDIIPIISKQMKKITQTN